MSKKTVRAPMSVPEIREAADLLELLEDLGLEARHETEDGTMELSLSVPENIGRAMLETGRALTLQRLWELGVRPEPEIQL